MTHANFRAIIAGGWQRLPLNERVTDVVRLRTTTAPFFQRTKPSISMTSVGSEASPVELLILYFRSDCFMGVFSADLDAVIELLPSDQLYPVRTSRGRAAVGIVAYNYLETSIGAYGEIGIAALCTFGRSAPPLIPLGLEARWPGFGGFVVHLPVTHDRACQAGRSIWGYPKFVADMAFDLTPEHQRVELREGGKEILSLDIAARGSLVQDNSALVTYSEHDGHILRTTIPVRSAYRLAVRRPRGGFELGEHPLADGLRRLDLSPNPIATKCYVDHAAILPAGDVIGRSTRSASGFEGSGAATGRHTIRYADGVEHVVTASAEPAASSVLG